MHLYALHAVYATVANTDPSSLFDLISKGGIPALLFVIIFGGYRKWWVFGWQYTDLETRLGVLRSEKNEWKEIALHSTNLADSLDKLRHES